MRDVLDLGDGCRWVEIETQADADAAGRATRTGVAWHFQRELAARSRGRRPTPYYALSRPDGGILAIGCVAPAGEGGSTIMVGCANADPWPDHAEAIARLGDRIRRHLGPECYPRRETAEGSDGPSGPGGP